jgi:hypothetical protein
MEASLLFVTAPVNTGYKSNHTLHREQSNAHSTMCGQNVEF